MTTQAFIVLTLAQRNTVLAQRNTVLAGNSPSSFLDPREIDNPIADLLSLGVLLNKWVLPARILGDEAHAGRYSALSVLPIHLMDSDVIFMPFVV